MTLICAFCGETVSDGQLSCCGENHFEERENCPECDSQDWDDLHAASTMTLPETFYKHCNECGHTWGMQ